MVSSDQCVSKEHMQSGQAALHSSLVNAALSAQQTPPTLPLLRPLDVRPQLFCLMTRGAQAVHGRGQFSFGL